MQEPMKFPMFSITVRRLVTLLGMLALAAVACGQPADDLSADDLVVVTTVSPITNIAANVACDLATVVGIVPEGVNSHTFEPSPSTAETLELADIVFVNGLNLEVPTVELARANIGDAVEIVQLGDETLGSDEYIFDFSFPADAGDPNPHLWTNPLYAIRFAEIIAAKMAVLDPDNADSYGANLERLRANLSALDEAARTATATVPANNRRLLTYHDSFPYFAREYGWQVIGAIQPADFSEPSPREVADLIDQVNALGLPAIFGSEVFASSVLETIAAETGAAYVDDLRDDDLPGSAGDAAHSYVALMVFDFTTIIEALGGDASALATVPTANVCDGARYAG